MQLLVDSFAADGYDGRWLKETQMIANKIPSVLYVACSTPGYSNSLSIERVLKQAIELLDTSNSPTPEHGEQVGIVIDSLQTLLDNIEH